MLKITQPYVRELPVTVDGIPIALKIEPPGYTIGLRLRHKKTTYHVDIKDIWAFATSSQKIEAEAAPKHLKGPSVRQAVLATLKKDGSLNIAQVMQQLKKQGLPLKRNIMAEMMELLKDAGEVEQHGFNYGLKQDKKGRGA